MMSRVLLLIVSALLLISSISATIIVSDDYGGEVGLSSIPGTATGGFSISGALMSLASYNLTVYITNEVVEFKGTTAPQQQSFYVLPTFNQATLVGSFYYPGTLSAQTNKVVYAGTVTTGNFLASAAAPNTAVGAYVYQFSIPLNNALSANVIYNNVGNPTVVDDVKVKVVNSHA